MTASPKVSRVADFVLRQLKAHQVKWAKQEATSAIPPLFVGVQGPQGSGKSFLTGLLPEVLSSPPHNLRLAALSLDDLYLPHTELAQLAKDYPDNKLLHGRGQPGTHDLPLGHKCLEALSTINTSRGTAELPVYDKSKFSGKGDRSSEVVKVEAPIDIVIFEGWATGFYSISEDDLRAAYEQAKIDPKKYAQARYGYDDPFFLSHDVQSLLQINDKLKEYEQLLWKYIDCFIQLQPQSMSFVWKWRLEQEHQMKAKNGGVGMTDDEVKAFIGRYMPGYELFLDGLSGQQAPWHGHGLRIVLDDKRDITSEEAF